ncbi:2-amino-4-hydroxy-6-hydroxymethyldihydropteridine diphosphokinase [Sporolituus thermophilus]|uniref:2-amino-4-hydroxy-6-hydroxymethyldihydropteridine diphosphokinase n=1 Tax=Sporolituus thermophilus DSM 23256 TaxID=1123285 RepID=A0A1G7KMV9_9FIRM|nr:2-amino-4-hydroxy-6-hydroxymethyldihydropteridine diphosphokinase [Sporolituus thermophilus]SDF38588.1 2-amino-4-hydroxy-6-hydroxymethyldihydropteridinediphosphokinase [Sporolituus thermophilus DSM 23256]
MIILGFGSNIGDREENIRLAIQFLGKDPSIEVLRVSSLYETEPVGKKDQPSFLNAVASIATAYGPEQLLETCLSVERTLGRVRTLRWGPRTIDIDILVYNDVCMKTDTLTLPHPRISERRFVLVPLQEITGDLPVYGDLTAAELLARTADNSKVEWYGTL